MKSVLRNVIRPVIGKSSGSAWTPASLGAKGLYWGKISEISGGEMPNKITGATDHIDIGGSAGSYTFKVPNTTPYQNADTDYIWFKTDVSQRTTTEAELVGYDFAKTFVKYDNTASYAIREIWILAAGQTLTTAEENHMRDYMELSIWWNDILSLYGYTKGNRSAEQSHWIPDSVYDADATALFARLLAKGETPTDARKLAMNTAIIDLKAAGLFATQWDVLVVTRGTGAFTTKENWIKDSSHALAVPNGGTLTYTADTGYHSDGTKSYLRTNFTPPTDGALYTQNDASFGVKIEGTLGDGGHGSVSTGAIGIHMSRVAGTGANRINNHPNFIATVPSAIGYNCLSRSLATEFHQLINAGDVTAALNSVALTNAIELHILRNNYTSPFYCANTEIVEMYWIGKSISSANYIIFQGIMNTYFTSL